MEEEKIYWVALNEFQKFGPIRWNKLLKFFPSMAEVWRASVLDLKQAGIEERLAEEFFEWRQDKNPEEFWQALEKEKVQVITIQDKEYPILLKEIYDPPPLLYFKGTLPDGEFNLAVVGTRKITPYGKQVLDFLLRPLIRNGLTIVSGLALGVDGLAHQITLEEKGKTVAILGGGLSSQTIYPGAHRFLAEEIVASGGCLLSEFPLYMPPLQHHFPYRNRLISGLSLGVLVIEATEDSGSLISAACALEQNREVFAVPGDIFQPTSFGTNNLLKMGAKVVTSAQDIFDALNLRDLKKQIETREIIPDTPEEEKILNFLDSTPRHIDEIIKGTKLKPADVSSTLTIMEMKGKVRHLGNMLYVRGH